MRKQAGSIEKSWLEAAMNSVDAGATKFEITIEEDRTVIEDDGSGMTEEEIDLYFKQFGFKDDDVEGKTFGKFRRGRGQIFNFGINIWHTQDNILVVNLDDETATIEAPVDIDDADGDVQSAGDNMFEFQTQGLGYNQQPATEHYDGTRIEVLHYRELDDVAAKVSEFKHLAKYIPWLHDIDIYVNSEEITSEFEPGFETEYAYFQFGDSSNMFADADVYNLGAYVSDFKIKDNNGNRVPVSGVVISKKELDLNNARNDIIQGDSAWEQIQEDYILGVKYHLAQKDEIDTRSAKWLIPHAADDEEILNMILDKDLLKDINGGGVALSDLQGQNYAFAPEGNAVAEEAMRRKDILMLQDKYQDCMAEFVATASDSDETSPDVKEGKSYEQVVDEDMQYEMTEVKEHKLSKRRTKNLRKIRWLLREISCYDDVKPGHSKHEDVWRPDVDTIIVDKNYLNANKSKFATEIIDKVVEIAAAEEDTRGGFSKDHTFYRNYHRYMSRVTEARAKILNGSADLSAQPALE